MSSTDDPITNLSQIVDAAWGSADCLTDYMSTGDKMTTLRNYALLYLVLETKELGMTKDHETLGELYDALSARVEHVDRELAQDLTNSAVNGFEEIAGDNTNFKLLFLIHLTLETHNFLWNALKASKDAGNEGSHEAFDGINVESKWLLEKLNPFQNRILDIM